MSSLSRTTATPLLAVLALAGGVAGCGSSSSDGSASASVTPTTGAIAADVPPTATTAAPAATSPASGGAATSPASGGATTASPSPSTSDASGPIPSSACALLTHARAVKVIPGAKHHAKTDPPVICSYASPTVSYAGKKGETLTLLWSRKKVSPASISKAFDQNTANLSGGAKLTPLSGIGERANLVSTPGSGGTVVWTQSGYLLVLSYLDYSGKGDPAAVRALTHIARVMSQKL